jgi:peroxiredoxin
MVKKIFKIAGLLLALLIAALFIAWTLSAPVVKIKAGDTVPTSEWVNIHDAKVSLSGSKARFVHLQFRRFAACPICNLHVQSFVARNAELQAAGIHEVVVFHSPVKSLLPYQGKFPFDVIADPEKKHYAEFGVGTSIFAILDPRVWPAISQSMALKDNPVGEPEGGPLGLPGDFLIAADGKVVASHYGRHAYDQWSVDEVLKLAKSNR